MRRFFSFLPLGFVLLVLALPGSAKAQENVLALPDGKSTAQSVVKWCLSTATPPTTVPCNASNAIPDTVTSTDGGTAITGATMPSGGAGLTGWLSAIWSRLGGILTATAPAGSVSDGSAALSTTPATIFAAASGVRYRVKLQNTDYVTVAGGSNINEWCRWGGTAAAHGVGSFLLPPGGGIDDQGPGVDQRALSCVAETGTPILFAEQY